MKILRRFCSSVFDRQALLREVAHLRDDLEMETDRAIFHEEERDRVEEERNTWRERAAILERVHDQTPAPWRRLWRRRKRRALNVPLGFELGRVLWTKITRITADGIYVRIGELDWLVHLPELSWGDISHPSEVLSVGRTVGVKTLSTPANSQHPRLVLV